MNTTNNSYPLLHRHQKAPFALLPDRSWVFPFPDCYAIRRGEPRYRVVPRAVLIGRILRDPPDHDKRAAAVSPQTLLSRADPRKMAVYTEVSDEDLAAFVATYDIGGLFSCKGIAEGVENTNYLMQTDRGQFILTLYEKRVSAGDLPFFLNLMEFLAEAGIPSPTPLHGRDGKALRTLCDRPAAIITFLNGMSPKRMQVGHCAEVGGRTGAISQCGRQFRYVAPERIIGRRLAAAIQFVGRSSG